MRSRRAWLFDIDGTLIGAKGVGRRAFERACLEVAGIEEALATVVLHGNTDLTILDEAFRARLDRAPTPAEAEAVLAAYVRNLAVELAGGDVEVMPSVHETLAQLAARGDVIGLATGNIEAGARLKLERVGLWGHFPFGGFGSDSHDRTELVRVAVTRAEARAGGPLAREDVWVIGDTPRDIAAAHGAGVRAIGVATGAHDVEVLRRAGADVVHETLATFLATLD